MMIEIELLISLLFTVYAFESKKIASGIIGLVIFAITLLAFASSFSASN